ncbi:hypothetical protein KR009_007506, partial [Drosophila setifemur]
SSRNFTMSRFFRNWRKYTLKSVLYVSWIIGIFPFKFNRREKHLSSSKWLQLYGLLLNFSMLTVLLHEYKVNYLQGEIYERNVLVKKMDTLTDIIGLITVIVAYLKTFWRSKELLRVLNDLLLLERRHFGTDTFPRCPRFDGYVIQKGLMVIMEAACILIIKFGILQETIHGIKILKQFSFHFIQVGLLLSIAHYHLAVLYTYRFMWNLNEQLSEMVTQQRKGQRVDPNEARLLLGLYNQILDLSSRLASFYDIQNTLFMAFLSSASFVIVHALIIHWININRFNVIIISTIFAQVLFTNLWDLWQCIAFCDLAEGEGKRTPLILKEFNEFRSLDKELEQIIDEFTLFCSYRRLRITHCGLFNVNLEMGFRMVITIILYILVIEQIDYMNLKYN